MSSYWDKRSVKIRGGMSNFVSDYANSVMCHVFRNLGKNFGCVFKTDLWDEGVAVERKVLGGVLKSGSLVGCDISKVTCKKVLDRSIGVFNGDIRFLPLVSNSFDLVVDNSTIDHVGSGDLGIVLMDYGRILKRNGVLVLVFVQSQPFAVLYQRGVVEGVNFLDADRVRGWLDCFFDVGVDRCHNLLGYFLPFWFWNVLLFHLPNWVRGVFLFVLEFFEFSVLSSWFRRFGGFRVMVGVKK